jgi:hypothetical protein
VPTGRLVALLPLPKPPLSRLGVKFKPSLIILGLVHAFATFPLLSVCK